MLRLPQFCQRKSLAHPLKLTAMRKILPSLFFILPFLALSQTPFQFDFGGSLGITSYQGDLDALKINTGFREINYSASLFLRRNFGNHIALRANLLAGKVAGDDNNFAEPEWRIRRGISFESPLIELSILSEIYPLGMYPRKSVKARRAIAPFVLVGFGAAHSNPKVNWNDENFSGEVDPILAQRDKDAKLNKIHVVLPIGVGFRFLLKDHSTFSLEAALRPTFSDYLDGVSQAGNPNEDDWYFTAQIGFSYPFGKYRHRSNKPDVAKTNSKTREERTVISDLDKDGVGDAEDECIAEPGLKKLKGCPDKDGDGIPDKDDNCPDAPGPASRHGCPVGDSDGDGVADKNDKCPDTPGPATNNGCPLADQDEDGVADADDRCPDIAGDKKFAGCPDSDGDGVPDDKDKCPDIAGAEKFAGCPDSDSDGIPDDLDDCPEAAGPASLSGCPDADSDGIADKDDACPNEAGTAAQKGCPTLPPPNKAIYFREKQDSWYRTSDETLDEVVETLQADPSLKAHISGHTDDSGESTASALSERRAKKIYDYLVSKGIEASRLQYEGFGFSRPVDKKLLSNDPELNTQLRRRVELRFSRE